LQAQILLSPAHDAQCCEERDTGQDEHFGLHSLKHRGVTDTKGNKKEASGHKTDAMMHVYDHSLPTVAESGT